MVEIFNKNRRNCANTNRYLEVLAIVEQLKYGCEVPMLKERRLDMEAKPELSAIDLLIVTVAILGSASISVFLLSLLLRALS
jgi:hypothetical protein